MADQADRATAPAGPWLIRPLDSLACTGDFLQALNIRGYEPTSTVAIYRSLCAFLLGHLLFEVPSPTHTPGRTEPATCLEFGDRPAARGPQTTPHRLALPAGQIRLLTDEDFPAEFERSLDAFVSSIRHRLPATAVRDPDRPVLYPAAITGEPS